MCEHRQQAARGQQCPDRQDGVGASDAAPCHVHESTSPRRGWRRRKPRRTPRTRGPPPLRRVSGSVRAPSRGRVRPAPDPATGANPVPRCASPTPMRRTCWRREPSAANRGCGRPSTPRSADPTRACRCRPTSPVPRATSAARAPPPVRRTRAGTGAMNDRGSGPTTKSHGVPRCLTEAISAAPARLAPRIRFIPRPARSAPGRARGRESSPVRSRWAEARRWQPGGRPIFAAPRGPHPGSGGRQREWNCC